MQNLHTLTFSDFVTFVAHCPLLRYIWYSCIVLVLQLRMARKFQPSGILAFLLLKRWIENGLFTFDLTLTLSLTTEKHFKFSFRAPCWELSIVAWSVSLWPCTRESRFMDWGRLTPRPPPLANCLNKNNPANAGYFPEKSMSSIREWIFRFLVTWTLTWL